MRKLFCTSVLAFMFITIQGCGKHSSPSQAAQSSSSVNSESNRDGNSDRNRNCKEQLVSSILNQLQNFHDGLSSELDSLIKDHLEGLTEGQLQSLQNPSAEKGRRHRRHRRGADRDRDTQEKDNDSDC